MIDNQIEELKNIIREKEPNLSDEQIDLLADQLMWLARLAVEDYMKVMKLTHISGERLSKVVKKENN